MSELGIELAGALEDMVQNRVANSSSHAVAEWDEDLWQLLQSQGFTALDDPDVGLEEFIALAYGVGQSALGLPVIETGIATWLSSATGITLNEDELTLVAFESELQGQTQADGSLLVSGTLSRVPWGRRADAILAIAQVAGNSTVVLLNGVTDAVEGENLAGEPRDGFVLTDHAVAVGGFASIADREPSELLIRGALMRAAAASGAMAKALDLTIEYANQREQFGRPIADFQAVQQLIVIAAEAQAMTDAAVLNTVNNSGDYRRLFASIAKQVSSTQSDEFTRTVHQVFAAIGATEEHQLQLLTRRLWSWQDECGSARFWSREIARSLNLPGTATIWELLTPPHPALAEAQLGEAFPW